jgi:glutamyl-Q tRNA(Asp) synthetase
MNGFVTRFAPSPTGRLHLGHALSAFAVWDAAEAVGGAVLLRIEDIDTARCRPEFTDGIIEDLNWLGLSWQGRIRFQSAHFPDYQTVLAALEARGLIYRCRLSRREMTLAQASPAEHAAEGINQPGPPEISRPFAWRLSLEKARRALTGEWESLHYVEQDAQGRHERPADLSDFGDIVLARRDTPASYHLACCHDDWLQGVSHVIRGEDLRTVTAIHVLLQKLMGWPHPVYTFHPLLLGQDGRKLAKRRSDKSLADYRKEGMTPQDIRAMCARA